MADPVRAAAEALLDGWDYRIHDSWAAPDVEEVEALRAALAAEPKPVEITDEQREQIVVAIQDHVMPRLSRPTSAEAGALREAVNRALSAALPGARTMADVLTEEDDERR